MQHEDIMHNNSAMHAALQTLYCIFSSHNTSQLLFIVVAVNLKELVP